ncbi:MAG: ABC transporter ATP-binding protein [Planctomycetota bacterium]|nr:ABC transporter ATP-binding protein [Planctomycetota bacterium]
MLVIENLRKSFGALVAVDGLSLEVRAGEVFGLLGPNGAGKSTTISMAIGLLKPDAGRVEIGGSPPGDARARARLGVATQSLALYDTLSAEENLRFYGTLFGVVGTRLRERVDAVLARVGLSERRGDRVEGFSGGMKRRLNLGVAMIHDPPLLLLDEPTAGVDPQSRASIIDLVRELAGSGKTIVYTTHYMEEAQKVCSRVGIIDKGRLLDVGTVDGLIARHGGESVVTIVRGVGDDAPRDVVQSRDPAAVLREALARDASVTAVHVEKPDLERVFLALTGRRLRD